MLRSRAAIALDCLLIALLTAWMVLPLFALVYMDRWISMESTHIGHARYLSDHWPHPRWQPLWYAGTRFDFLFPPAMYYATAALGRLLHVIPARAYHLCAAVSYCVGIAGVYLLIRVCTGRRGSAWLGALWSLLVSPVLLFIPRLDVPDWPRAPLRLVQLTQWGEGPHIAALGLVPIALACGFLGFQQRPAALAAAALLSALIVSTSSRAATAWLIFFAILLWSFWITHQDKAVFRRAALIGLLSWALPAFWLLPPFLHGAAETLRFMARPGTTWSVWIFLAAGIAYMMLSDRYARGRPERFWPVFVLGSLAIFLLFVVGGEYLPLRLFGKSSDLLPELELVLVLVAAAAASWLWRRGRLPARIATAALVLVSLATAAAYVGSRDAFFAPELHVGQRPEHQIQQWVREHAPGARVVVAGSFRLAYDTWHDLPQLGGGSDAGARNILPLIAQSQILTGEDPDLAIEWMRCMGVDYVVVNGPGSKQMQHEFRHPGKFGGRLPVSFDNRQGDIIYAVPRRFPGIARVVEAARLNELQPFGRDPSLRSLRAYAAVVEGGPDAPATVQWQGSDSFRVHASLQPGQLVLVQECWDAAWRAWSGGRAAPVRRDPMGFMLVEVPAGEQAVTFRYTLSAASTAGRAITLLALIAPAAWFIRRYAAARL